MIQKILSLLVCVCVLICCLSGCASAEIRDYTGAGETAAPEQSETLTEEMTDYSYAYAAHAPDEQVMTVNGLPVYWDECFYWLNYAAVLLEYYGEAVEDWDAECALDSTMTNREFVADYALDSLVQYRALETGAAESGAVISDEQQAELDALWDSDVQTYAGGDEAEFEKMLADQYMDRDTYEYLNRVTELYYSCMELLFGPNGEKCADTDVLEYADSTGYVYVKHILFSTVDENNEPIEDEAKAEKKTLAESALAEIREAEQQGRDALTEKFDELMDEYNEDPGYEYYKDGYCSMTSDFVGEFGAACEELGDYEVSDIVETSYGYHIILRMPMSADAVVEYYSEDEQYTIRSVAASDFYAAVVSGWIEQAQIEYAEGFKDGSLADCF